MQQGKIVGYDKDEKIFHLQLPEEISDWDGNPSPKYIKIAHDFIEITADSSFQMEMKDGKYPYEPKNGPINWVKSVASIQIPIREVKNVLLPMLLEHQYLQDEHFKLRTYEKDDEFFEMHGKTEPRYKKGDKYPPYAYHGAIIYYYDNINNRQMVKFRRKGETNYNIVDVELFNQIKDSLKLSYSKDEKTF